MTERERWIVYPLLFLALGAALRDKLFDTTMSRRIVCQELVVVDEGKYPEGPVQLARIGAASTVVPGTGRIGRIEVNGRIDAEGYFVRGMPMTGPFQMNISVPDLIRAWQRATERQQGDGAAPPLTPDGDASSQLPDSPPSVESSGATLTPEPPDETSDPDSEAPTTPPSPLSPPSISDEEDAASEDE